MAGAAKSRQSRSSRPSRGSPGGEGQAFRGRHHHELQAVAALVVFLRYAEESVGFIERLVRVGGHLLVAGVVNGSSAERSRSAGRAGEKVSWQYSAGSGWSWCRCHESK
jgi:hypothetical protein